MGPGRLGERAAVVGSGMAGLFAARVLADHFDEVVILDRDDIPDTPSQRDGVPQGKHFHALLPGGLRIGSELFPGFTDDLAAAGAVSCMAGEDFFFYRPEGKSYALAVYQPEPRPLGVIFIMSRSLLEHTVRQRVVDLANVRTMYRALVRDPLSDGDRVTGVRIDGGMDLRADLVVDATGRNGRLVGWLRQLGFPTPDESIVSCDFAYASALLDPRDPDALGGAGFFVIPDPASQHDVRGAYLVRIEGDRWLAGLGGRFGDYPPVDADSWRAFGRTLSWPVWDEAVSSAEMLTPPVPYRFPRSVRRHFERLEHFPDGLIGLGDSVCHFNPVYGQGMSAAACQAQALASVLDQRVQSGSGLGNLAQDFFPMAYEVTRTPWTLAAALDFMDARTTGDFPAEEMPSLAAMQLLGARAESDDEAAQLLIDIFTLVRPLSAVFEPPWPERLAGSAA